MNKKSLLVVAAALLAVGAIMVVINSDKTFMQTNSDSGSRPQSMAAANLTETNNSPQTVEQPAPDGTYVDYTSDIIAKTPGQKVLFFHAPWCWQCRNIEEGIKKEGVPSGLTIIKVDYDANQALRRKYGVRLQTTFVKVDDQGNGQGQYVAYDEPTFEAVKRNFL